MRWLFFLLLGVLCGLHIAYRFDICTYRHSPVSADTVTIRDTVIVRDTVRVPQYKTLTRVRVDTVLLPSAVPQDSTVKAVEVPIEQQEYRGDGWHAWISGFRASMDSLIIDRPTVTIDREVTRLKRKHWGWQAGIGLSIDRRGNVTPGLYAGFGYQF